MLMSSTEVCPAALYTFHGRQTPSPGSPKRLDVPHERPRTRPSSRTALSRRERRKEVKEVETSSPTLSRTRRRPGVHSIGDHEVHLRPWKGGLGCYWEIMPEDRCTAVIRLISPRDP